MGHLGTEVRHYATAVPGAGITQVNVHDSDGNHIEAQFTAE